MLCYSKHEATSPSGLCRSCLQGLEQVSYSKHLMTPKRHTFKMLILYSYTKNTKELIHRFKFSKELHLSRTISSLMLECMDVKNGPDLIVPVPSHPFDEIKRGYSHMLITAKQVSKMSGIGYLKAVKRRFFPFIKRSQRTRNRKQRLTKRNRFCLAVDHLEIKGKRIILIDDVSTTGSTIMECSELLLDNGAGSVEAVCFALTRL